MNSETQEAKRAVAVLPAYDLLFDRSPQEWLERFREMCGVWPTDVALPAITNQGATFDSEHADEHRLMTPESNLKAWISVLRDQNEDLRIWLLINPSYESIQNDLLVIVDQWGEPVLGHACLSKPLVLKITEAIVAELQEFQPDGIVFDLTNVYPNAGSTLYPRQKDGDDAASGLQNTCFCNECVAGLSKNGWTSGSTSFRTGKLRLSRFLLQGTPTGTTHIDVRQPWIDDHNEELLLQYARERAFVEDGDVDATETQREEAQEVLRYLAARGKVTSQTVKQLCNCVRETELQSALILGDADFELAQNTSLAYLARADASDEYWVPLSRVDSIPENENPAVVQFLSIRGTYYANSLFEDIWWLLDSRSDDISEYEARLRRTAGRIRGDGSQVGLSKGGAKVASMSEETRGFAGVPFEREDIAQVVRRIGRDHQKIGRVEAVIRSLSSAGPSVDDDGGEPANPLYG